MAPSGWVISLSALSVAMAAPPDGWSTCGGLTTAYNNTACPTADATCCKQVSCPRSVTLHDTACIHGIVVAALDPAERQGMYAVALHAT